MTRKLHHTEHNEVVRRIKENDGWLDVLLKLCKEYYAIEDNCCGGNLHIVLDDGNLDDHSLSWCAGLCCGREDDLGDSIVNCMQFLSKRQRSKLYKFFWEAK